MNDEMKPAITSNPDHSLKAEKLEKVESLVKQGVDPKEAAAEVDVPLKAIMALPKMPPGLRRAIERHYATDDLTKAAALAKLLEVLETAEDEGTIIKAAKALLDAQKKETGTNVGVFVAQPPPDELEALKQSVEDKGDE